MTQFVAPMIPFIKPVRIDTSKMPLLDPDAVPDTVLMRTFMRAVTARRDHGTATEGRFVAWLINRLPVTMVDAAGNVHVDLRTQPHHRSMFTAHTDSVHRGGGVNTVRVDGNTWRADIGHALGADDGAGCALLCHMIDHKIPGYYVFFRGEECGGVGSTWLAANLPNLFAGIDRAIAFDRADYYDVITHQMHGRCCSDKFAQALADELSTATAWYMPCDTGVFTDTANLTELIPECTNISVGYKNQHGDREEQDIPFLVALSETVLTVAWDDLPTERDHTAKPKFSPHSAFKGTSIFFDDYAEPETRATSLGAHEYELMETLELALVDDHFTELLDLIARQVYPDSPETALPHLSARALDEHTLNAALDQLDDGAPADSVLDELFDVCYRS